MPRTVAITSTSFRRHLRLQVGPIVDSIDELIFRIRSGPRGLAHRKPYVTANQLDRAVELGARFLSEKQSFNGCLSGFLLYPGASTTWLTAHVTFVVENIPQLEGLCRRAAEYLSAIGPEDGGWGYNRRVAPDCDSTAQALMAIHRFGMPMQMFLLKNLVGAQLPCGGFPTYPPESKDNPENGWQMAHPEVSAVVSETLRRVGGCESSLEHCLSWVNAQFNRGVLPAYWWSGYQYGLWVQARTGLLTPETSHAIEGLLQQPMGIPALPFVLTAAAELPVSEETLCSLARMILLEQNADGSWNCQPCLRVTSPKWFQATPDAPGDMAADRRRIFSTAHSVAALFRVRKRLFQMRSTASHYLPPNS